MSGTVIYHKSARRYYIQLYWEGVKIRIWRHPLSYDPFFDERSAQKQLHRIQTEIDDHEFDPKYWLPDSPMLLSKYAEIWVELKEVSKKTKEGYESTINKYIIPFFKQKDIRRVRANDIKQFKKWLGKTLSPKTVYNKIGVLKTIMKDAYDNEDIQKIPPFPKLSMPKTIPAYIELEQQELILSAIPERHRPIFQIGMEYGLRVGEVRAIQKDCINDGILTIKRAFSDNLLTTTKTDTWREYNLTSYAIEILNNIEPHLGSFIFVREDGNRYTSANLNKIWHKACSQAGIKIKLYNAFRHSLGCQLLDMGYDMDHVRQQLGHTNMEMTKRYARRSNPILANALENRRNNIVKLEINK